MSERPLIANVGYHLAIAPNEFIPHRISAKIEVIDDEGQSVVLSLNEVAITSGGQASHAVAKIRTSGMSYLQARVGDRIASSVIWVPDRNYSSDRPFDTTWWRGGAAAIADIIF